MDTGNRLIRLLVVYIFIECLILVTFTLSFWFAKGFDDGIRFLIVLLGNVLLLNLAMSRSVRIPHLEVNLIHSFARCAIISVPTPLIIALVNEFAPGLNLNGREMYQTMTRLIMIHVVLSWIVAMFYTKPSDKKLSGKDYNHQDTIDSGF